MASAELFLCLAQSPGMQQQVAQVVVNLRIIRQKPQSLPVMMFGVGDIAAPGIGNPEIVVQILILGFEAQGILEHADGALGVAGGEQGAGPCGQFSGRAIFLPAGNDGVPIRTVRSRLKLYAGKLVGLRSCRQSSRTAGRIILWGEGIARFWAYGEVDRHGKQHD